MCDERDPLAYLCVLFPDAVADALTAITASDVASQAAADAQHQRDGANIASEILEGERREETINLLGASGVSVERHEQASPEAIISIEVRDPRGQLSLLSRMTASVQGIGVS